MAGTVSWACKPPSPSRRKATLINVFLCFIVGFLLFVRVKILLCGFFIGFGMLGNKQIKHICVLSIIWLYRKFRESIDINLINEIS